MTRPDLVAWMLNHARADIERGRAIPAKLPQHIHDLLAENTSDNGRDSAALETVEVGVTEMALNMGCSPEWVRYLCRTGRLQARRIGRRDWLIATQEHHADDQGADAPSGRDQPHPAR